MSDSPVGVQLYPYPFLLQAVHLYQFVSTTTLTKIRKRGVIIHRPTYKERKTTLTKIRKERYQFTIPHIEKERQLLQK